MGMALLGQDCSIFESPDIPGISFDLEMILKDCISQGELSDEAITDFDPRDDLLSLLNILLNLENGLQVIDGLGYGLEPLPNTMTGGVFGTVTDHDFETVVKCLFMPDTSLLFPSTYKEHQRTYHASPQDAQQGIALSYNDFIALYEETHTNFTSMMTLDDILVYNDDFISMEFEFHEKMYINVYEMEKGSIFDYDDKIFDQDFDYIKAVVVREHFPDKAEDKTGFIENQYSLNLFFTIIKDHVYLPFQRFNKPVLMLRAVWTSAGATIGNYEIQVGQEQILNGIYSLFDDYFTYLGN